MNKVLCLSVFLFCDSISMAQVLPSIVIKSKPTSQPTSAPTSQPSIEKTKLDIDVNDATLTRIKNNLNPKQYFRFYVSQISHRIVTSLGTLSENVFQSMENQELWKHNIKEVSDGFEKQIAQIIIKINGLKEYIITNQEYLSDKSKMEVIISKLDNINNNLTELKKHIFYGIHDRMLASKEIL